MDASDKDVKLSAEVEPFIPQKNSPEGAAGSMSLPGDGGGAGGGASGGEATPIPSYLITCYPFPFPGAYAGPLVGPAPPDVSERPVGPAYGPAGPRGRGAVRPAVPPKQQLGVCQPPRGRRPPTRTAALPKEVTLGPDGRTKMVMLVDAAQQTGERHPDP
ncbi:Selenocysteine insertion sequence-binding protein 2-like [Liparis tanakae]|uniref:Selenocysteine insertion sequence-binding protein 2-like n=1 Tax=Liparis tanakae TaxID=230148 RepID=A0A4Z2EL52_9TELE|nr:Selenocysteine insertion sequence-binding protein 2-like [Liparis tanakae]